MVVAVTSSSSRTPLQLLLLGAALLHAALLTAASGTTVETVYEWHQLDYDWPTPQARSDAITNGQFKQINNIITGVKWYKGIYYVTVPRWKTGVPSTLNTVINGATPADPPVLKPFPNWEMQNTSFYSSFWYVQSMEIDPNTGLMWVLDVGRLYFADPPAVNGAPKLVLLDLNNGAAVVHTFVFPDSVASYTSSFLNDLAVDHGRGVAYISDTGGDGALVTYNYLTNTANRYTSVYTQFDPSVLIRINGIPYPEMTTPCDSIALDPVRDVVYFAALVGKTLYSVSGTVLRNFALNSTSITAAVKIVGPKPPSDGMAMTNNGVLYYGDLSGNSLLSWNVLQPISTASVVVAQNNVTMQWIDTFAFGSSPNTLIFTTNRLQLFFYSPETLNNSLTPNFRVMRINISSSSYFSAQTAPLPLGCAATSGTPTTSSSKGHTSGQVAGAAIGCLVAGLLLGVAVMHFFFRDSSSSSSSSGGVQMTKERFNTNYTPFSG